MLGIPGLTYAGRVTSSSDAEARRAFADALALFGLHALEARDLVWAATDLLNASPDSGPYLVALTGAVITPTTSPFEN